MLCVVVDSGGDGYEWDFFVSYTQVDRGWAEWVAWQLEAAGHRVLVQAWHMVAGMSWSERMAAGMARSARTVAMLSPAYVASEACGAEWQAAWRSDLVGRGRRLLPVRVAEFSPPPPFDGIVWTDLYGVDETEAATRLGGMVEAATSGEARPSRPPSFPGAGPGDVGPRFPAAGRAGVWSLPWERNRHFTGREEELSELRSRLVGDGRAATVPQALHGLGGVGKTQLAVQYAYRHARDYDLVWWVPAEDPALALTALAALAERVGVAVAGQAEESAHAVVELLRQGGRFPRWLVILDNAERPEDLYGLLSAAGGGGHVLVTTRDLAWSRLAGTVEVDVLPRDQAVVLLRARVPRLPEAEAGQIAAAVDDLPLALAQAGAWLAETGTPARDYVDLLRERVSEVMARGIPADHAPVAATWTIALRSLDEPAVLLARLWAQFGPEPIPVDLIRSEVADLLPAPLGAVACDPLALRDIIGTLVRTAIVRLVVGDMVVMHRLVQAVLRDDTPDSLRPALRQAACGLLAHSHPENPTTPDGWRRYAQLYPHALATDLLDTDSDKARDFILALAWALRDQGDYPTSRRLAEHAHHQWSTHLGEDHPDTIRAAGNFASNLADQGDYPAARALKEDVLARRRRILGEDHPATIMAAGNLANTLVNQGDYPAARAMQEDVLARLRRVLGEDHPDTISAAGNLAITLGSLGDYAAARALEEDVLARRRRILGEDHPDTIMAAGNLANILRDLGDYAAARVLGEDVLARLRRVLGEDHPDTIMDTGNLAATLGSLGDYAAARALEEDVFARRRRILGEDHPATIMAAGNLAATLGSLGDYAAARALEEDVFAR
ncbi:FxSxx-COOH system tetratricopeptide repeat protein, partial [Frankia nepalensis]